MANARTEQERRWTKRYLQPLVGAKITRVEAKAEDDGSGWVQVWPVLHVSLPDGTKLRLEVSQDPEGNGPGFLFGLPRAS